MKGAGLKYSWLTYRRDQLWFPLAFLLIFVVIVLMMRHPGVRFSIARAYLGFIVPLTGGILAAYGVLDDPALELRFSTPVRAEQTLLARVGLILAVQAALSGASWNCSSSVEPFRAVVELVPPWMVWVTESK